MALVDEGLDCAPKREDLRGGGGHGWRTRVSHYIRGGGRMHVSNGMRWEWNYSMMRQRERESRVKQSTKK